MAKQVWTDKETGIVTEVSDTPPDVSKDFTLADSKVGGPDRVADGPGVGIAGVGILIAMISWLVIHELYSRKSLAKDEGPKP